MDDDHPVAVHARAGGARARPGAAARQRALPGLEMLRTELADAAGRLCLPEVNDKALDGLKFSSALPHRLAVATLATRLADLPAAAAVLAEPIRVTHLA